MTGYVSFQYSSAKNIVVLVFVKSHDEYNAETLKLHTFNSQT